MRSQLSEDRRTTQDGRIWPVDRARMQSATTIRERMIGDIDEMVHDGGEDAVVSLEDLGRKGWTPDQIRQHGVTAFNIFQARQNAEETTRESRASRKGSRMVAEAAALAIFAAPVLFWAGVYSGAI